MLKCARCGAEIPDGAAFCGRCGAPTPVLPPRFAGAHRQAATLQAAYRAGSVDRASYDARMRQLVVEDESGYWLPDPERGAWYWWDGQQWVPRPPPLPEPAPRARAPQPGPSVPRWLFALIPAAVLVLAALAVVLWLVRPWESGRAEAPQAGTPPASAAATAPSSPTALPLAATPGEGARWTLSPEQQDLVDEFGWPHAFSLLQMPDEEGTPVRYETWTYHDGETQYVFVDGAYVTWQLAEAMPGGTIATPYRPTQFALGDGPETVSMQVPAGEEWVSFPVIQELVEGAEAYAGPQLIAAFAERQLVYLEALALTPEEEAQ